MKKTIVLSIGIVLLGVAGYVLFFGISFTTDISDKEEFWGGYQFEKEYIFLRDVFLQKTSGGMASRRLILIPEKSFKSKRRLGRHAMSPDSISEYESDPENAVIKKFDLWNWKINVVGIV